MSYFNMVCDSCGRGVQGITWVNGMKFCAKCYQETFGDQQNKESNELLVNSLDEKDRQITELKKQLEEKEKEIESLRENSLSKRIFKEKLIPSHCMEQYEKYEQQIYKLTKDKISFAVEQLEKVKEFFLEEHRDEEMDTNYIITKDAGEIADYLLDQIKSLKGEE